MKAIFVMMSECEIRTLFFFIGSYRAEPTMRTQTGASIITHPSDEETDGPERSTSKGLQDHNHTRKTHDRERSGKRGIERWKQGCCDVTAVFVAVRIDEEEGGGIHEHTSRIDICKECRSIEYWGLG